MDLAVKNFYKSFITLPKKMKNNLSNESFKYFIQIPSIWKDENTTILMKRGLIKALGNAMQLDCQNK